MSESPSSTDENKDLLEMNQDLERMIEDMENLSVQVTWMAYDMVVRRTGPEQATLRRQLEDAYQRCRAVICGDEDEPKRPELSP